MQFGIICESREMESLAKVCSIAVMFELVAFYGVFNHVLLFEVDPLGGTGFLIG